MLNIEEIYWHRLFGPSSDKIKLLGNFNQVTIEPNQYSTYFDEKRKLPSDFEIPYFVAHKKATKLDMLNAIQIQTHISTLLVSPRCKELLGDFKLSEHTVYKTYVVFGSDKAEYYIYHFNHNDLDAIDYNLTEFYRRYLASSDMTDPIDTLSRIKIENGKEYLAHYEALKDKKYTTILAEPLVIRGDFKDKDLIKLFRTPFISMFLSTPLKEALIKNKISAWGMESALQYYYYGIKDITTY